MSKQAQANTIFANAVGSVLSRKDIIAEIQSQVGVSPAYASTLYNNAKKAAGDTTPKTPATKAPTAKKPTTPKSKTGKISSFDRTNLRQIRAAIASKLAEVEAEFGISLNDGNIRFSDNKFSMRIEATTGDGTDAAQEQWNAYAWKYGLKDSDFGREFSTRSGTYTISGIKPRGKKFPITGTRVSDGASFKFTADSVKRALGA